MAEMGRQNITEEHETVVGRPLQRVPRVVPRTMSMSNEVGPHDEIMELPGSPVDIGLLEKRVELYGDETLHSEKIEYEM